MMGKQASHARDIGSAINELVESLGIRHKLHEYEAVLQWDSLVGEHVAKAASAVKIAKGILLVRVKNSTWRNELSLRKHEIIRTINTALNDDIVKDIKFQ